MKKKYHIGLDFGTYQSKACIYNLETKTHEFFKFPSTKSYFLPSIVTETEENKFEFGKDFDQATTKSFYYFKIAAADDPEFRTISATETFDLNKLPYNPEKFKPYTPEFLAVIYITFILLTIKAEYEKRSKKTTTQKKKGFLARAVSFVKDNNEPIQYSIQLGIPTEWSRINNLRRKRKFENILLLSELLQEKFNTLNVFLEQDSKTLLQEIERCYLNDFFKTLNDFEKKLDECKLAVYPETAAGLTFIIKTKQITRGYYAIMDIGGGSTDVSFFCYEGRGEVKYLASESYEMAANNVYSGLLENDRSIRGLHAKEKEIQSYLKKEKIEFGSDLYYAIKNVRLSLQKLTRLLFAKRVYWQRSKMLSKYNEQPIIIYGGGMIIPGILNNSFEVHDNGNKTSIGIQTTNMEVIKIDNYSALKDILPNDESWRPIFHMLVVALGLSFIQHGSSAKWIDTSEYQPVDGDRKNRKLIPHPFNEDYYIYDVLASKFK